MMDVDDGTAIILGLAAAFLAGAGLGDIGPIAILAFAGIMLSVLALVDGVGGEDEDADEETDELVEPVTDGSGIETGGETEIVLRGMDESTADSVVEDLSTAGINRDVIRVEDDTETEVSSS